MADDEPTPVERLEMNVIQELRTTSEYLRQIQGMLLALPYHDLRRRGRQLRESLDRSQTVMDVAGVLGGTLGLHREMDARLQREFEEFQFRQRTEALVLAGLAERLQENIPPAN